MSRDKYSDDHTIKLNEGTGTLTVDGNLAVTGDVTVTGNNPVDSLVLTTPVDQILRISGSMFLPLTSTDFGNITRTSAGRLSFSATAATVDYTIREIPNGATITQLRIVGSATGAADDINVLVRSAAGVANFFTYVNESYNNQSFDAIVSMSSDYQIDATVDEFLHITITGDAPTTAAYIDWIDVYYSISEFPVSALVTP